MRNLHVAYLCREYSSFCEIYCDRCNMLKEIELGPLIGYARVSEQG